MRFRACGIVGTALVLALFGSCTPIRVHWSPSIGDSGELGTTAIQDRPELPRRIRWTDDPTRADFVIDTDILRTPGEPPFAISRKFLVPSVSWTDPRRDIGEDSLRSIENGTGAADVEVLPLENVRLPRKMLAVDGRRPGDDGYPLVEWTVLTLNAAASVGGKDGLSGRTARVLDSLDAWLGDEASRLRDSNRERHPVPATYRIAAVGDIMPGRGFDALLMGPGGIDEALGGLASLLSEPQLLIGNLETAVTESRNPVPKSYNFKVPRKSLEALVSLGFDFFHLANNHGWDYGEDGFLDTLDAVAAAGVGFSGAGGDLDSARFAWETETADGRRIRILSLGTYYAERNGFDGSSSAAARPGKPGVLWDSPENEEFIRGVLGSGDAFTIVTAHGGYEWENVPRDDMRIRYRRYVDWGADLVLAHHPHVLQGAELYEGGLIAYSLGNFIFPGMKGWYTGEETGVLDLRILDGRIIGVDFHPVLIDDIRLRSGEGTDIADRFWKMSRDLAG